jgi:hypothetical protein
LHGKGVTKIMKAWVYGLGLGAALFGMASDARPVQASEQLSCQDRIVHLGDEPYRVRSLCGDPDDVQQRVEQRAVRREVRVPCGRRMCSTLVDDVVDVQVEEWIYDFGPQRLLQYLTFETGRLVRVRTGEYGHKAVE